MQSSEFVANVTSLASGFDNLQGGAFVCFDAGTPCHQLSSFQQGLSRVQGVPGRHAAAPAALERPGVSSVL